MIISTASVDDIEQVIKLLNKYHINFINEEDKHDGFVTTMITREQLKILINQEHGLFIAKDNGQVVAFVMAASWYFWESWPLFKEMITMLPEHPHNNMPLTKDNSYQYGPICIDKSYRGNGLLENIFNYALSQMASRYEILVTFVNKRNPRSKSAHTRLGLTTIDEFEYNNNHYYWMSCLTQ
jgi:hypothetical protein